MSQQKITVETTVKAPLDKVWERWTAPEHIVNWNFATDTWKCPRAENDLRTGGKFSSRMEAKDGSMGFDFGGVYDEVVDKQKIRYTMGDNRQVEVTFKDLGGETRVTESFDPESMNPREMQQAGWQMILDNFRKYSEG